MQIGGGLVSCPPHTVNPYSEAVRSGLIPLSCLLALVGSAVACGSSGSVEIADGWAGSMPATAENGAIYLTIRNGSSEGIRITGVTSPRCGAVELHESLLDDQQVMRMRPATEESLTVPGGAELEMVPGALHIMCVDAVEPFAVDDQFDVTVTFDDETELRHRVTVENR